MLWQRLAKAAGLASPISSSSKSVAPPFRALTTWRRHLTTTPSSGFARSGQPRSRTVVLLCDMQQAFDGKFEQSEQVTRTAEYVLEGCSTLGVPVVVSEHQPEKLGETVASLGAKVDALAAAGLAEKFYKTRFSMRGVEVRRNTWVGVRWGGSASFLFLSTALCSAMGVRREECSHRRARLPLSPCLAPYEARRDRGDAR